MNGDFTNAFAETIGTMWDSKEPSYGNLDTRAVNYFLYEIMLMNNPDENMENERPEVYDNGGE
jgi:hypothetical protein